jgi:hypothetical protein
MNIIIYYNNIVIKAMIDFVTVRNIPQYIPGIQMFCNKILLFSVSF